MTILEREAWAAAYRLYDEYAQGLRQAAALDDENAMACRLFAAAGEKLSAAYNATDDGGRLIMLAAYGILEEVFHHAQKRHQERPGAPQEARDDDGRANAPPDQEGRQSA